MGLPPTWAILNIYHAFVVQEASIRSLPEGPGAPPLSVRLCGDDALLACSRETADRYDELLAWTGARLSPGKHFRETRGRNDHQRGVFLEDLVTIPASWVMGGPRVHVTPTLTLASLVFPAEGLHVGATQVVPKGTLVRSAGRVVEALAIESRRLEPWTAYYDQAEKLFAVQMTLWGHLVRELSGSTAVLPTVWGGFGFVTSRGHHQKLGRVASRFVRKAMAVQLTGGRDTWSMFVRDVSCAAAGEDAAGLLARVPFSRGFRKPKGVWGRGAPWYDCGPVDEFLADQSVLSAELLSLSMPLEWLGTVEQSLGAFRTRVLRLRQRLVKSWPSAHPLSKERVVRDLVKPSFPHIFLPGTPDPRYPGTFGVPWVAGDRDQDRMRTLARSALGLRE